MTRFSAIGIGFVLCCNAATAQEQLSPEHAQRAAQLVSAAAAKLADLPVKVDADTAKPFGLKKGDLAALVIPDKGLSAELLGKAGKEVLPVGQLWLRGLTPVVAGSAVPADKLRMVKVAAQDQEHELSLLLLGVRQGAGKVELLVYGSAKEPLLVLPLDMASKTQEQPIELAGRGEGGMGVLTLHVLGKHQAELPVTK